jgi:hypothetical protein
MQHTFSHIFYSNQFFSIHASVLFKRMYSGGHHTKQRTLSLIIHKGFI